MKHERVVVMFLGGIAGVLVPFVGMLRGARYSLPLGVAVLFIGLTILVLLWRFSRPRLDIFHPLVLATACFAGGYLLPLMIIVLQGKEILLSSQGYSFLYDDGSILARALAVALVGYFFFIVGFLVGSFGFKRKRHMARRSERVSARRIGSIVFVYAVVGVLLWGGLVLSLGGLKGVTSQMSNRLEALSGRYYLTIGAPLLLTATCIWLAWIFDTKTRRRFSLFLLSIVALFVLVFNGGSRTPILVGIFSIMIIRHYLVRRFSAFALVTAAVLLSLVYVGYQVVFREYAVLGRILRDPYGTGADTLLSTFLVRLTAGSVIMLQTLMVIVNGVPDRMPYQWGATFVAFLLSPVPRVIFPGKPISPAGLFSEAFFPSLWERGTSVPPSLIGEFYLNYGVVGVVVGMFLFGGFYRLMYNRFVVDRQGALDVIGYAFAASMMYPWLRGETFAPTIHFLLLYLPLRFAILWSTYRESTPEGRRNRD